MQLEVVASRKQALARGLTTYFTGKTCAKGHLAKRYAASGMCSACMSEKRKRKYWADLEKARERARKVYGANPEHARGTSRRWYANNPEKAREYSRQSARRMRERHTGFITDEPQECRQCKLTLPAESFAVDRYRKSGRKGECRECVALAWQRWKVKGYEKRQQRARETKRALKLSQPKRYWAKHAKNALSARTKARGETHDITVDWLVANAPERCPLLGIPLRYDNDWMAPDSPSVDRMDSTKGYSRSNCWIISSKANRIKTNATVEEIETVGRNIRPAIEAVKKTRHAA